MKKKTITKAVILTATILMLTGCNSSTGVNPTTVSETSSAIVQEISTSIEQETETSSNQETETSSIEETTTTTGADEPTIPETTAELENVTQVAGYDGICDEYGNVAYDDYYGIEYFCMEEGAPIAAWKDAWSKYKYVGTDASCLLYVAQYKGHSVPMYWEGYGFDDGEDLGALNGSADYRQSLGYEGGSPFTYDLDLNIVCADSDWSSEWWIPDIMAQEVRDGVTWYEYVVDDGYYYWLPEHNGADWEQVYKKYVEEPYEAKYNSMSEEEKVNEILFAAEQVWNKTYYNVVLTMDSGSIRVTKQYAYKNADGTITRSNGWENCDSSIFEGTSLLENGSIVNKDINDGVLTYWQMDGDRLYILGNGGYTEMQERGSELYYHLIDLYGEECVYWNADQLNSNQSTYLNAETIDGRHDWDVYGDGKDRCKSIEEHVARCQGN